MIRTVLHPEAMRERASELEIIARRLRAAADGDWPEPVPSALLKDWSIGTREIEVVVGTRVASGKHHKSSPLLVVDEERGIALSMHQTYRLGAPKASACPPYDRSYACPDCAQPHPAGATTFRQRRPL